MAQSDDKNGILRKLWKKYLNFWEYSRPYEIDEDSFFDDIKNKKIGWSWCETKKGVHHTGIVVYVDGKPKYTVNWAPKNGARLRDLELSLKNLIFEVEGQIWIENESDKKKYKVDYHDEIPLRDEKALEDLLKKLTTFSFYKYPNREWEGNAEDYELAGCNCRDHVEAVMCSILRDSDMKLLLANLTKMCELRINRFLERTLYKLAFDKAIKRLRESVMWGYEHPNEEVPKKARRAAARVFHRYYTFDCLCQGIDIFDPSIETMDVWCEKIETAYQREFGKDLTSTTAKLVREDADLKVFLASSEYSEWMAMTIECEKKSPQELRAMPKWVRKLEHSNEEDIPDFSIPFRRALGDERYEEIIAEEPDDSDEE